MKPLSLADMIPPLVTFHFPSDPEKREHTLRPFNIEDREWAMQTFNGPEGLNAVFAKADMAAISRLTYHLLQDKSVFAPVEEDVYDPETGEKTGTQKVGGYRALMRAIRGVPDQLALQKALLKTIGVSEPIQAELEKELSDAEKKSQVPTAPTQAQPSPPEKSTGKKSSTSSKASTGSKQTGKSPKR